MHLEHPLLYDNVQVVVPPTGNKEHFSQVMKTLFETTTPIVIYGIADDTVSKQVCLSSLLIPPSAFNLISFIHFD
jgi:hypothetical protein